MSEVSTPAVIAPRRWWRQILNEVATILHFLKLKRPSYAFWRMLVTRGFYRFDRDHQTEEISGLDKTLNCKHMSQREAIWHAQKAAKSFSGRAPPRTPLGELTTLLQTPSRLGREKHLPFVTPLQRLNSLFCFPVFLIDCDLNSKYYSQHWTNL